MRCSAGCCAAPSCAMRVPSPAEASCRSRRDRVYGTNPAPAREMRRLRIKQLHAVYWIATLLFIMPQGWAAVQYLIEAPRMVHTITQLGYPEYFMAILGVAK